MKGDRIKIAAEQYDKILANMGIKPASFPTNQKCRSTGPMLAHCRAKLKQTHELVGAGKMGEAVQILNFVAGVLWANSRITEDELFREDYGG